MRRPSQCATLLARALFEAMDGHTWIDREMKMRFCVLFVGNLIDGSVEREVERELLDKVKGRPVTVGIRLLRRRPVEGLRVLITLIMEELRDHQGLHGIEQIEFYDALFRCFFPDVGLSDATVEMANAAKPDAVPPSFERVAEPDASADAAPLGWPVSPASVVLGAV